MLMYVYVCTYIFCEYLNNVKIVRVIQYKYNVEKSTFIYVIIHEMQLQSSLQCSTELIIKMDYGQIAVKNY